MRFKNEKGDLNIYAVAGTQTVLLSFEIPKKKIEKKNFLGFVILRKDSKGTQTNLHGSKYFPSLLADVHLTDSKVKYFSPIQSFMWKDYLANPGETYTYTVQVIFGTPLTHSVGVENSIKVTTEKLLDGTHSVFFNYGVTGSQAYLKRFDKGLISELTPQKKQDEAYAFLGRELWGDGLLQFANQANGNKFQLYGVFYELQHLPFLQQLNKIKQNGATVEIRYSAKPDQKIKNESAIAAAGIQAFCSVRTKAAQPHNKFMILCENNIPTQVWTGSTNITLPGIFGQCNTGHWIKDKKIAQQYFTYWTKIKDNPAMKDLAVISEQIQPDTDLTKLGKGTYVFFSPRHKVDHLTKYMELLDSATEMVCMVFPFNIDEVFLTEFRKDKDFLRLLLFEHAADAQTVKSNDIDVKVTAGAVYSGSENAWAKEITSKTTTGAGILYVHNKFFIIDALSDNPKVLTGSANFSKPSITDNDENSILVVGDKRVADIYLTEFDRLFEHFWPRYIDSLKKNNVAAVAVGFNSGLDETYTWFEEYYDKTKYVTKRKEMFKNMNGAKRS